MAVVSERIQIYRAGPAGSARPHSSSRSCSRLRRSSASGGSCPTKGWGSRSARRGFRVCPPPAGRDLRPGDGSPTHVRRHDRGVVRMEPRGARRGIRADLRDRRDDRDDALAARRFRGRLPRAGPDARAGRLRAERAQDAGRRRRGGLLFAGAVWWTANTIWGDGLFHLARVRKLEAFDLTSLNVVNEFRDGGLTPATRFRSGIRPARSSLAWPTSIPRPRSCTCRRSSPLAVVLAYAAGAALFGRRAQGSPRPPPRSA